MPRYGYSENNRENGSQKAAPTPAPSRTPYRLQVYLPRESQHELRDVAHAAQCSMQELVSGWLLELIHTHTTKRRQVVLGRVAQEFPVVLT